MGPDQGITVVQVEIVAYRESLTLPIFREMIDIHSHILPGLDDGASGLDVAIEMLRLAAEDGVTDIAATPHANAQYQFLPERVEHAVADLNALGDGTPRIHFGCELQFTPENIESVLRTPWHYTIGHRCYVLVEFCNLMIPKTSGHILGKMRAAGAHAVIAHPERNPILRERTSEIEIWVKQGCLLQATAQSLLGQFGRSAESAGLEMIERGLIHCVASDTHDPRRRPPLLSDARRLVTSAFGEEIARRLFEENPRQILRGGPVERCVVPAPKKAWYAFW